MLYRSPDIFKSDLIKDVEGAWRAGGVVAKRNSRRIGEPELKKPFFRYKPRVGHNIRLELR